MARLDNQHRVSDVLGMFSRSNVNVATMAHDPEHARSVLIVDDDEALVEALTELLRDEGHVVEAHTDGFRALARLKDGFRPDVVLLDYLMPRMNGSEFLVELERHGIALPIVLFTAMNASRVHVPTRNVIAMIRKPFDLKRLFETLAKVERR